MTMPDRLRRVTARGGHQWYRIEAAGKASEADVWIYDEVGMWGTTADDFAREVAALDVSTLNLHLNTPGGSVFDGIAIYNTLKSHKASVNVSVDGVAASIGSVIAMAGDTVTMGRGTSMMIHNPSGLVLGQAQDMREMADLLDKLAVDIAGFYSARAGGAVDQWLASMAQETWYGAQEAVDAGLADSVLGADVAPAAQDATVHDLTAYAFRHAGRDRAPAPVAHMRKTRSDAVKARVRDTLRGVESK
jgi:ATP-dependent Clp endopeptidase proteolytic subunit ClpP